MTLYNNLFYSQDFSSIFSDEATIGAMLQFEAALAEAQGDCGIIPNPSVLSIQKGCQVSLFNIITIIDKIKLSGNAAIPLVKELTEIIKKQDSDAAKYVHFGATSQDVVDTGTVLQLQKAFVFFEKNIEVLQEHLISLAQKHRSTVMIGRTLLQQARPITFGLKIALWLDGIHRSLERLREIKKRVLVLQLGGAVGSLAGMEGKGLAVAQRMAEILNLNTPSVSWHTQRDRFAEMATTLGILMGSLSKLAKDITLLMQTEVGEIFEGAADGKGGSSTMPHKRNPVTATAIIANANRVPPLVASMLLAMSQEHERSAGLWHSEWAILPEIAQLTAGALEQTIDLIQHLEVDPQRMLQNLEATQGLIYAENISLALAPHIGKMGAHHLIEAACKTAVSEKKHLKTVLLDNPTVQDFIPPSVLEALFDPKNSIGLSIELMDKVLNQFSIS